MLPWLSHIEHILVPHIQDGEKISDIREKNYECKNIANQKQCFQQPVKETEKQKKRTIFKMAHLVQGTKINQSKPKDEKSDKQCTKILKATLDLERVTVLKFEELKLKTTLCSGKQISKFSLSSVTQQAIKINHTLEKNLMTKKDRKGKKRNNQRCNIWTCKILLQ